MHTLRLLLEAANSDRDTEVVSSEWLMPRYVRAFARVEQKNYAAAAAELDAVLAVAPYEPQFLADCSTRTSTITRPATMSFSCKARRLITCTEP